MNNTVGIILSLAAISLATYAAKNETIVECLLKDESKELYIKCPQQSVIRVLHTQFGYQNRPVDDVNSTCIQQEDDVCAVEAPHDLKSTIMEKCMGQQECLVVIKEKYLYPCTKYANYFQILYQCILDKTTQQERMIIDVCGEVLGQDTEVFRRPAGYIESLNYPDNYSPDTSCTCHLQTAKPDDSITLEILDMAIHTPSLPTWSLDWLEYTNTLQEWGEGKRLNAALPGETINLGTDSVYLNFNTDANIETRGFWLKYAGLTRNGSSADVQVNCMVYKPFDYKTDITCFTAPDAGEMFLNCKSVGLINVLHAQTGNSQDHPDCGSVSADQCAQTSASLGPIRNSCMGKEDCHVVTHSEPLAGNGCPYNQSNYVQVQYQCVKDALDPANSVDICGDIMGDNEALSRKSGYIESMDYSNKYSPDTKCYCELSIKDFESEVILLLLDADLGDQDDKCGNDWLEFVKGENKWGKGEKMCDKPRSEPIHTGSRRVFLNFYADSEQEGRGFWIKYKGLGPGGEPVPVLVTCAMYSAPLTGTTARPATVKDDNAIGHVRPANDDRTTHEGLIVGLSVTAALMLVLVVIMVMFKCKREKSQSSPMPSDLDSSHTAMPTGYGTLQKFADLVPGRKPPYSTLDESLPNSLRGKPGYQGSSSYPEYIPPDQTLGKEDIVFSQPAGSAQYVNPAYDGTIDNLQHNTDHHIKL